MGEEKGLTMTSRNLSKRFWLKVAGVAVGVPLLVTLILLVVVLIKAAVISAPKCSIAILNEASTPGVDDQRHPERARTLAGALRIQTISYDVDNQQYDQLALFVQYVEANFPLIHTSPYVERIVVSNYSLLYKVGGSVGGKVPYLLASHIDVVPASPDNWDHPPFGGAIVDGFVYGRGAIDDKGGVMAILEALEFWLSQGGQPKRSFFLAFGHDEEIGGFKGAAEMAKKLRAMGVNELDFVLDEGLVTTDQIVPGVSKPAALIGVTEKGFVDVELQVTGVPQHSSFPPKETPIGILGRAVSRLEDKKQPIVLGKGPEKYLFQYLAPDADFGFKMLYANLWIFKPLMADVMEEDALPGSLIRTTTGLTRFTSGIKDNVIPAVASAFVNHRVHPGQTVAEVLERDRKVIDDDRVLMTVQGQMDPHPVSPFGPADLAYQLIATSVYQSFEQVVVAPCMFIANTDTIHYLPFSSKVYRFFPTLMSAADTSRYHGDNERIAVDDYKRVIDFYFRLMQNADLAVDLAPDRQPLARDAHPQQEL